KFFRVYSLQSMFPYHFFIGSFSVSRSFTPILMHLFHLKSSKITVISHIWRAFSPILLPPMPSWKRRGEEESAERAGTSLHRHRMGVSQANPDPPPPPPRPPLFLLLPST